MEGGGQPKTLIPVEMPGQSDAWSGYLLPSET